MEKPLYLSLRLLEKYSTEQLLSQQGSFTTLFFLFSSLLIVLQQNYPEADISKAPNEQGHLPMIVFRSPDATNPQFMQHIAWFCNNELRQLLNNLLPIKVALIASNTNPRD